MKTQLTIDPEFKSLIPPLTSGQLSELESLILENGCEDALWYWEFDGKKILVDGHNREDICRRHGKPYEIREKKFSDRFAAKDWILHNSLGRRSMTEVQRLYVIGKRMENEKERNGGDRKSDNRKSIPQVEGLIAPDDRNVTAGRIAKESKVSRATVERAQVNSKAVDSLASRSSGGEAVKNAILNGDVKMTHAAAAAVTRLSPQAQHAVAKKIVSGASASVDQAIKAVDPTAMKKPLRKHFTIPPDRWASISRLTEELAESVKGSSLDFSYFELQKRVRELFEIVSSISVKEKE